MSQLPDARSYARRDSMSSSPPVWSTGVSSAPTMALTNVPGVVPEYQEPFISHPTGMQEPFQHELYYPPPLQSTHAGPNEQHPPEVFPYSSATSVSALSADGQTDTSILYPVQNQDISHMAAARNPLREPDGFEQQGSPPFHAVLGQTVPAYSAAPTLYSDASMGYVAAPSLQSWPRSAMACSPYIRPSTETGQLPSNNDLSPGSQQLRQQQPARSVRPRRSPRRLTTREEASYQCEVEGCGKLFSRSYNYKAHMETHDENREYPFPCQVSGCDKRFVRKTDLQRHHQSVHAKERNYKCDYCGRMFARKDTLRRHMDDGCSKRFDLGTMDLQSEGYDDMSASGFSESNITLSASSTSPAAAGLPAYRRAAEIPDYVEKGYGSEWR